MRYVRLPYFLKVLIPHFGYELLVLLSFKYASDTTVGGRFVDTITIFHYIRYRGKGCVEGEDLV